MITAARHPLKTQESTVSPGDIDPRQLIPAAGLINNQRVAAHPARMKLLHCPRGVAQSRAGGSCSIWQCLYYVGSKLLGSFMLKPRYQFIDILQSHAEIQSLVVLS